MEAKLLNIPNHNNCLACDAFLQINFAPEGSIPESSMEKIYFVKHEGNEMYLKLIDMLRISFSNITSTITLPATGKEAHEWREWWLQNNPDTKADTKMAVYYFKKHKD